MGLDFLWFMGRTLTEFLVVYGAILTGLLVSVDFHMNPNETIFLETAQTFIQSGLRDAGYNFLNSDDGWLSPNRSATGALVAMPAQFPSGLSALTQKLHALGFHFGIYGCASETTCGSRAGSLYREAKDAQQYASWGVSYLKFDDCGEMNLASYAKFSVMRDAIARTGRPMVYSFEPYTGGLQTPWLGSVGNSWRTGPDARPHYSSVIGNAFVNNMAASLAGPGHFNDADMLEIGNGDITLAEARTQFSLWCLMKSPLLIGADMQTIAMPFLQIMKNKELIAGTSAYTQSTAGAIVAVRVMPRTIDLVRA